MLTKWEEIKNRCIQGIFQKLPDLNGVTLRDTLAMSALNGLISNSAYNNAKCKELAMWAYEYADAMLEARDKK